MKKLEIKLQFKKKFPPKMLMARLLNLKNKLFKLKNFQMVILKKNKLNKSQIDYTDSKLLDKSEVVFFYKVR